MFLFLYACAKHINTWKELVVMDTNFGDLNKVNVLNASDAIKNSMTHLCAVCA